MTHFPSAAPDPEPQQRCRDNTSRAYSVRAPRPAPRAPRPAPRAPRPAPRAPRPAQHGNDPAPAADGPQPRAGRRSLNAMSRMNAI
ncbi:hypothetical protein EIW28_17000 [Glycomyces terrestris]|uniref:Uncharacterized protein n=1 Tax=Glycomyces terrestris TaxID=2493553 RepID=A0A426UWG7_9ACTN|nr:hypothetical protein EIW28_17000 [Glycomyces terrestris]